MEGRKAGRREEGKGGGIEGKEEGRREGEEGEGEREEGTINQEVRKDGLSSQAFQRNKTNSITITHQISLRNLFQVVHPTN